MNRESVSEVMDARACVFAVWDCALPEQEVKGLVDGALVQSSGPPVNEERRVGGAGPDL